VELDEAIRELEANPKDVRFSHLLKICVEFFGAYRTIGSHHIFKTRWQGDPRINLQEEGRRAKRYQVRQVISALKRLKEMEGE
jgi:hypothetical protein